MYKYIDIYVYLYIYIHICIYTYIYRYIERYTYPSNIHYLLYFCPVSKGIPTNTWAAFLQSSSFSYMDARCCLMEAT